MKKTKTYSIVITQGEDKWGDITSFIEIGDKELRKKLITMILEELIRERQ